LENLERENAALYTAIGKPSGGDLGFMWGAV
jgi:tetrahydromethanopterin S-methyltransferase subunit G